MTREGKGKREKGKVKPLQSSFGFMPGTVRFLPYFSLFLFPFPFSPVLVQSRSPTEPLQEISGAALQQIYVVAGSTRRTRPPSGLPLQPATDRGSG